MGSIHERMDASADVYENVYEYIYLLLGTDRCGVHEVLACDLVRCVHDSIVTLMSRHMRMACRTTEI